jgi:hypothetical protein
MIKGRKKRDYISYEEILKRTNGGYDVYMYLQGKVPKRTSCPWRRDRHESFGYFCKDGIWFWRDIAKEESGTAVEFVMKKFNMSFGDAIHKIAFDFGWTTSEINANPVIVKWEKKEIPPVHITFSTKKFEKRHHEFWNVAGVTEADCKIRDCYAIKDLAINRKHFSLAKGEIAFAYYAPEEDKCKIYLPDRPKDNRFYNNVSFFYLWNYSKVEKCKDLIVQTSMKDLIVTSVITPCVIATQAEATKIFNEEVVEKIDNIADNIWVWYGSDDDGVDKCKKITSGMDWKYINTPRKYLPEVNDCYGMAAKYGLKAVEEFMKTKHYPI